MSKLITALSILGIMLGVIVAGVSFNQAWISGLVCLIGWTPGAVFLGMALAGINFSVSIKDKSAAIKQTEGAQQIRQRVSKVEQ